MRLGTRGATRRFAGALLTTIGVGGAICIGVTGEAAAQSSQREAAAQSQRDVDPQSQRDGGPLSPREAGARSSRRSTGTPDFRATWARRGCTSGQPCPFIPTELPLKARAIGFIQAFDEPLGPKYDCVPATMPSLVIDPYNFAIEQRSDRLVFTYEKDDIVRTIWLEGHAPQPTVYDVYWQGHSVGRYENGELVIETTKFPFDPTGLDDMYNIPSSTQKKVVERYKREGSVLKAEIVTEDPLFLTKPIVFTFEWERTDRPLELPYACDPELAKQPLKFIPSKYQDPGYIALPPLPSTPPSP